MALQSSTAVLLTCAKLLQDPGKLPDRSFWERSKYLICSPSYNASWDKHGQQHLYSHMMAKVCNAAVWQMVLSRSAWLADFCTRPSADWGEFHSDDPMQSCKKCWVVLQSNAVIRVDYAANQQTWSTWFIRSGTKTTFTFSWVHCKCTSPTAYDASGKSLGYARIQYKQRIDVSIPAWGCQMYLAEHHSTSCLTDPNWWSASHGMA